MKTKPTRTRRILLAVAEPLELRTLLTSTPPTFAAHVDFTAGTTPVGLAAADFNGDGNIDLAVADSSTSKVNIFFGNGNGAFSAGPVLVLSSPPTAIITGDFTNDGRQDIAVACTAGTAQSTTSVDVFLNNGNGTFGVGQITTVEDNATPGEPVALAAADFGSGGFLGLAVTEYTQQLLAVLIGNGNGTFSTPTIYPLAAYPTAVTTADFNNDGNPDIAVATSSSSIYSAPGGTNSVSYDALLLQGDSSGNFTIAGDFDTNANGSPAGIIAANISGTTPGLIVGNADGTASVFTNSAGSFNQSDSVPLAAGSTALAVGDFDLDGNIDFVSADGGSSTSSSTNSVTVAQGNGDGTFSTVQQFSVGTDPADVVVADFNNDGKPDIATANSGGTVSILLNTTPIPLITTSTALTVSSASAPAGSSVTLTAKVTIASASTLSGETQPTGAVKFYDGSTLLGSADVVAGSVDTAQFITTSLAIGTHSLHAIYQGDPAYNGSNSPRVSLVVTPTATEGPDLIGSFVSTTLPATAAPGETASIRFELTNQGNTVASGSIVNSLYLSLDGQLDGGQLPITLRGGLAHAHLNLPAGKSVALTGSFALPAGTPLASYFLLLSINSTGSLAESVSTNNVVVSPAQYAAADVFGTVDGRRGVALQVTDGNGTPATFRLNGPGNGTVNIGDDGLDVVLHATTAASVLTVTSPRGSAAFDATDLSTDSPIGSIRAATVNVTGDLTLPGGAVSVTLASAGSGAVGNQITIGSGPATVLNIHSVPGTSLTAAGGIRSLTVTDFAQGSITAGWIGALRSAQGLSATLSLTGSGAPGGVALSSATIGGTATGAWSITGGSGRISIASVPASISGWSLSQTGALKSLLIGSSLFGTVSAASIGSIQIRGNLDGGAITANANIASALIQGDLINADILAANTSAGTLGSLKITGSVTSSLAGAAVTPNIGGTPTINAGGTLRSVTVLGTVDSTSKFLAALLPKKAILGGVAVIPASDPHFAASTVTG
jgi:hypothetical protein